MKFTGNVLVAEDNPSNQMLIKLLLQKMGFQATIAEDGQAAIDIFESKPFKVVLMDMMMPNKNGYEATQELRDKGIDIPIIAVTANAMKGDREKCLEAGCDEYISKPITMAALEKTISMFVKSKEQENMAENDSSNQIKLDENQPIISELADDPDLCVVAEMFVERLGEILDNIKTALDSNDNKLLKDLFHEIKGAGGSAGFPVLTEKSAYIESLVLQQKVDEMTREIEKFYKLCDRVQARQPA